MMWRTGILNGLLAALAAIALAGCAGQAKEPESLVRKLEDRGYAVGEQVKRVQNYRLHGWHYLDDWHVIMLSGPSEAYLISLRQSCRDLRGAERLAFSTTVNDLTDKDKVMVRGPSGMVETCYINTLHRLQRKRTEAVSE